MSCGKEWQIQCEHEVCREAGDTSGRTEEGLGTSCRLCLSTTGISQLPILCAKDSAQDPLPLSGQVGVRPLKISLFTQKRVRKGGAGKCGQNVIFTCVKVLKDTWIEVYHFILTLWEFSVLMSLPCLLSELCQSGAQIQGEIQDTVATGLVDWTLLMKY